MNFDHRVVKVAATQMACSEAKESNLQNAIKLVREAAAQGAQIILLQELFHGLYFCQVKMSTIYVKDWFASLNPAFHLSSRSKRVNISGGRQQWKRVS